MSESKLPWSTDVNKNSDDAINFAYVFDAENNIIFGCSPTNAKLIVDSVNNSQRYKEALEAIKRSGNDLSTGLAMTQEGDLAVKYPYSTDNQIVLDDLGYGILYCMWVTWATIMRERDNLEPPKEQHKEDNT